MSAAGGRRLAELREGFEDVLGRVQYAARLIGGENGSGPGFSGACDELRVALAFPEPYDIASSNQALQILYHLAGSVAGVGVERVYLPGADVIAALREEHLALPTLETWWPVTDVHVLGVTLQHELSYTNLLELLDLCGVTLRAAERTEDEPLVIAGGPATANFLPVAPFFDAVVVGDGEEVFPRLLETLSVARKESATRREKLLALGELPGIFVPGVTTAVRRQAVARLEGAPYPTDCLVPLTAAVHDRAWVEVMRGCTRGCRFCQAGMWYRPVRERTPAGALELVLGELAATGYEEVSLASLSSTDYTSLVGLLEGLAAAAPEVRVNLPSLRVDTAAVRLAHVTSPTGGSLTLAPEAGSQRLRDVINKNVSDEDILTAAREAFRMGMTTLKLYFMMGLPTETDDDVLAIADLVRRLQEEGRLHLGSRRGRLQLNVSVTNFIPKPFTPFQWAAMAPREVLEQRRRLLRSAVPRRGVKLATRDVGGSYLEAALARGGSELAEVIEGAWRRGARFDAWTERYRPDAWAGAFAATGLNAETLATTVLSVGSALPWDVIAGGVSAEYLAGEWEKARRGETTPDCRSDVCGACGVCEGGLTMDLAVHAPPEDRSGRRLGLGGGATGAAPSTMDAVAEPSPAPAGEGEGAAERIVPGGASERAVRYLLSFAVTGRARFLGHLDTLELLRRAVRRAGGRLALSEGMRPKPQLSLALPRAVGVEGRAELCEFSLASRPAGDFAVRLAAALPQGMVVSSLEPFSGSRSLPARVVGARYRVQVAARAAGERSGAGADRALGAVARIGTMLTEAASSYTTAKAAVVERIRESGSKAVDVKAYVSRIDVEPATRSVALSFTAEVTPNGTVRPEEVVAAVARIAGVDLVTVRCERLEIVLH